MNQFQEVKLSWGGKTLIIRPDQVMRAIAVIEEHVTIKELSDFAKRGTAPMARLALAYADLIKFAGGEARSEDIYATMFSGQEGADAAALAINGLLQLMLPPGNIQASGDQDSKKSLAAAPSSKKRSKQRSATSGSPQQSSGV